MSAPWLMVLASLLFATMGVCVKLASAQYGSGEIVFYRGLVGALMIGVATVWKGTTLRTAVPARHFWRSLTGVTALCLWFYAIGNLPLATAMTLNYSSSVWMALFLLGSAAVFRTRPVDRRLVVAVLLGFTGVALILRPTIEEQQLWHGLAGLLSGMVSAMAYLQVTSLGRAGEPEGRIVFYFSVGGIFGGALLSSLAGWHAHTWGGIGLLLAVGVLATVAQLMITRAYAKGRPLVNASLQYLGIAFSFLYGVLLFGDRITWLAVVGMLLIVAAGVRATLLRTRVVTASSVAPSTET
ncbi:DMT family transporter [Piscinibacter sp. XHJ-5]|uniref:DMT family transporter n=1 Tax=Piscinibacter sp. XHJ-5 TaxID=3037797 RepID=UPI0024528460|nr:DMT family transporter [Piscinibacter sp. XHJ-5]